MKWDNENDNDGLMKKSLILLARPFKMEIYVFSATASAIFAAASSVVVVVFIIIVETWLKNVFQANCTFCSNFVSEFLRIKTYASRVNSTNA